MSIFKKISQKLEYAKMKNATITPKGICFREYCKKIRDHKWTPADTIEAYEEEISIVRDLLEQGKYVICREDVADYLFQLLCKVKEQ